VSGDMIDPKLADCPALVTVKLISGKWKTRILWHLRRGACGFGELERALTGISPKMLSEHLAGLQQDGLIVRSTERHGRILHSVYDYSDYGRTLIPVLDAIGDWGLVHAARQV
jgi:DNA-binding HxlR family transcriptional regulator